jgi:hypothetical protein
LSDLSRYQVVLEEICFFGRCGGSELGGIRFFGGSCTSEAKTVSLDVRKGQHHEKNISLGAVTVYFARKPSSEVHNDHYQ